MEQVAIEKVRLLREAHLGGLSPGVLEMRAEVMHDILRDCHGNVKLRLEVVSNSLGCTMRTLERDFIAQYSQTMNSFHEMARLEYAEMQITFNPDVKLTAVAAELGYDRESELNRFFKRKRGISLTEFAQNIRSRQKQSDFSTEHVYRSGQN